LFFEKIQRWQQVAQFSGAIVAYQASTLTFHDEAYSFKGKLNWYYGYIEKVQKERFGNTEYNMQRLIKKKADHSNCVLDDSEIKKSGLAMRLATVQEKQVIYKLLKNKIVEFDYMFMDEGRIYAALGFNNT
jgi:hypothetical protein